MAGTVCLVKKFFFEILTYLGYLGYMVKDLVSTWLNVGYNLVKAINIGYKRLILCIS